MKTLPRIASTALLAAMLITPAVEARTRVYVNLAPPPLVVEQSVPAPGPGYIWQAGHHRWNGNRYEWQAGTWARPPHPHARWVAGRWVHNGHGHYWEEGHWARR